MSNPGGADRYIECWVPSAAGEVAADLLWGLGASAIAEQVVGDSTVLTADVPLAALRKIAVRLTDLAPGWHASEHQVFANQWSGWKADIGRTRIGDLWVAPIWASSVAGDLVFDTDTAWGHGAHPTTVGVGEAMLEAIRPGSRVLDFGCGSGILTLLAAASEALVEAIDCDPAARATTADNLRRNQLRARVGRDLADVEGPVDVVAANVGAIALATHMEELLAICSPTGILIGAGFTLHTGEVELARQWPPMQCRLVDGWPIWVWRYSGMGGRRTGVPSA